MNKFIVTLVILIIIAATVLLIPDYASAQTPPPPPSKPAQNPIDGGLGLLAAAGGAYAIKKIRDKKK